MVFRINVEEKLLSENFGEEYKTYITKTSRILPHIW
jgi:protein-S-isoprenylcysteine O-methyltransferase Ste14